MGYSSFLGVAADRAGIGIGCGNDGIILFLAPAVISRKLRAANLISNQIDRGLGRLRPIPADFSQAIRLIIRQAHDKSAVSGLFRGLFAAN
jgi:hypothetical protein